MAAITKKPVLVVFETYSRFADAGTRLKALTREFGKGGSIKRSESGFEILVTPELLALIESGIAPTRSTPTTSATLSSINATQRISQDEPKAPLTKQGSSIAKSFAQIPKPISKPALVGIPPGSSKLAYARNTSAKTGFDRTRLDRMAGELRHAYNRLPPSTAASWATTVVKRLGVSFTRRVGNVVDLSIFLLEKTGELVIDFSKAVVGGKAIEHLKQRGSVGWASGTKLFESSSNTLRSLIADLRSKPRDIAPELLVSALAFFVVGGGLDGDGGVPDLDIELFGIGGHRSIFTHSIVAGTIIETSLYSLIDLVVIAHNHLPDHHDPLWDTILKRSQSITEGAVRGSSAGLAYHLAVDAVVQPGVYRDLPFSAPIEVHEGIAGANSVSELKEAVKARAGSNKIDGSSSSHSYTKAAAKASRELDAAKIGKLAVGGAVALAGWLLS